LSRFTPNSAIIAPLLRHYRAAIAPHCATLRHIAP
jgi:hypothetical protein